MLHAIAFNILGGFATYMVAKIASSGRSTSVVRETVDVPAPPPPPVSIAPVTLPPAVRPAPVESKAPPPPPPPPVDTSPKLPTPVVLPPVVIAPPAAKPPPVVLPPVVLEAPKPAAAVPTATVERAPPPPPPPPPADVSTTLPTPRLVPDGPEIEVPVCDKYAAAAQRPAAVTPTVTPSATPSPAVTAPPAGFDPTLASTLAPALARQLAAKGYDFDRAALRAFQTAAGLEPDGIYGNDSWGALLYFTSDAPRALYKPSEPTPYVWGPFVARSAATPARAPAPVPIAAVAPAAAPAAATAPTERADVGPVPPPGFDPKLAKSMAKNVSKNIDTNKSSYSRPLLRNFQTAAGLEPDGIYGGGSRRALMYYGIDRPPPALFKPTATPAEYLWAPQADKVLA